MFPPKSRVTACGMCFERNRSADRDREDPLRRTNSKSLAETFGNTKSLSRLKRLRGLRERSSKLRVGLRSRGSQLLLSGQCFRLTRTNVSPLTNGVSVRGDKHHDCGELRLQLHSVNNEKGTLPWSRRPLTFKNEELGQDNGTVYRVDRDTGKQSGSQLTSECRPGLVEGPNRLPFRSHRRNGIFGSDRFVPYGCNICESLPTCR